MDVMRRVCEMDQPIDKAWKSGKLQVIGTGSSSPCLDLLRINSDLCNICTDVDLVILEGMGRAIHTNFYANFKVDSVKIGGEFTYCLMVWLITIVFKNAMIAEILGASMYDGMCLFKQVGK